MIIDEVQDLGSTVQYIATLGQTFFPVPFPFPNNADIVMYVGTVKLNNGTDYNVSGAGNDLGGSLTLTVGAPVANAVYTIIRDIAVERATEYQQNGPFTSAAINAELNNLVMIDQQLEDKLSRAIRIPVTSLASSAGLELNPAAFAGAVMTMDANGNILPGIFSTTPFTQTVFNNFLDGVVFGGSATDVANAAFVRNAAYVGGTPGFVNSAFRVTTNVTSAGATAFEWAFLSIMNNFSTAGNNVAGYHQANKNAIGPTWASVSEVRETSAVNNPVFGTIGHEIDIRANGTDAANNRIGCDLVVTKFAAGAACQAGYGYRIQNAGDGVSNVGVGFGLAPAMIAGVAFDASNGVCTTAAFQCALNQPIIFDGPLTQNHKLVVQTGFLGLDYLVANVLKTRLLASGGLQVLSNQVVGAQQGLGVAAATFLVVSGTAINTGSTFDGYTLPQVVKAMRLHGLLA